MDEPKREQRLTVPAGEGRHGTCRCGATVLRWVYPKTGREQLLELSTLKLSGTGSGARLMESHYAYCRLRKRRRAPSANERRHQRDQRDPWLTR